MKNVSIIVPVYKDWETLQKCIRSLKKHVSKENTVLLVNDKGPDWQEMEAHILEEIRDVDHFQYFANKTNLGFVKTCNRAVYELDKTNNDIFLLNSDTEVTDGFLEELSEVLYLSEKHGAVCPRSNNATLLTVPVHLDRKEPLEPEESYQTFLQIKDRMPRYDVIPTGVGFALLIKRQLIDRFGLFDEIYGLGYNEENDFCQRINQYGFSIVKANRAFVYHYESKSFGDRKSEIEVVNHRTLCKRYPYYDSLTADYFDNSMLPADRFADLIVDGLYEKKKLLFSLYEVPSSYNGTAQYGLSILESFYRQFSDKYEISILINKEADEFHGVSKRYPRVYHPDNLTETFHLAFAPSQIIHMDHLLTLNRAALRYVFCMQDIISIRSAYLYIDDMERLTVFRKSIQYCDGMTSISRFSLKDTMDYYREEFDGADIPTKVIYHGMEKEEPVLATDRLPFKNYVMVFGNFYKHKYLKETLECLKNVPYNFIILGASDTGKIAKNIYGYQSGGLSDEFLNELMASCRAILFPSLYEGFGLPLLNAIKFGKNIIMTNNELNRELKEAFSDFSEHVWLFDRLEEVRGCLKKALKNPVGDTESENIHKRTWDDAAKDLELFLAGILEESVDTEKLSVRWNDLKYISDLHRMYSYSDVSIGGFPLYPSQRLLLKSPLLWTKLKIYNDFPRLYKVLKRIKANIGMENTKSKH